MNTNSFTITAFLILVSIAACKHRRSSMSAMSNAQGQPETLERFDFYDDEGYPIPRESFSIAADSPKCTNYLDGETIDTATPHSIEVSFYTFDTKAGIRTAHKKIYNDYDCKGEPKEKVQDDASNDQTQWIKIESESRKALFSGSFKVLDYGSEVCYLVDSEIESEVVFCTNRIINRIAASLEEFSEQS